MKLLTKLCCAICIFFILASGSTVFSEAVTTEDSAVEILKDLGIMEGYLDGDELDVKTITRAELADILVTIFNVAQGTPTTVSFSDVPLNHWACASIETVSRAGILVGMGDGSFHPDAHVTQVQAIKVLVCLLGYGRFAENDAGYPAGYLNIAAENKLLDGITVAQDRNITIAEFAQMIYNALEVPVLQQISFGTTEEFQIDKDITMLYEYFSIEIVTDIVRGNDRTMLSNNNALPINKVQIGTEIYNAGVTDISEYLGYRVKVYYKVSEQTEEKYILHFSVSQSDAVVVMSEDIIECKNGIFSYYDENLRSKERKLSATVDVIVNGSYKAYYTAQDMTPENGFVRLIDSNGDGVIDVVLAETYLTYFVDSIDEERKIVYDKYLQAPLYLDEADTDRRVLVYYEGKKTDFSSIGAGDVLTVAADKLITRGGVETVDSSANVFKIYITRTQKSGLVSQRMEDEVLIGDEMLKISPTLTATAAYDNALQLNVGETVTVATDWFGKVAAIVTDAGLPANGHYGYIVDALQETGLQGNVKIKLFSVSESDWKIYDVAENIRIDGAKTANGGEILSILQQNLDGTANSKVVPKFVIYRLNAQEQITYIDTAKADAEGTLAIEFSSASSRYISNGQVFDGKVAVTDQSVILCVPLSDAGEVDINDSNDYVLSGRGTLVDGQTYNIEVYNLENNIAKMMVCYVTGGTDIELTYNNTDSAMIDRVTKVVLDDEEAYKVYAYQNHLAFEFYCDSETDVYAWDKADGRFKASSPEALKRGDIIRYTIRNQKAIRIEKVFSLKTQNQYAALSNAHYELNANSSNKYLNGLALSYGLLHSNAENVIRLIFSENVDDDAYFVYRVSSYPTITLYDEAKDRIETVSIAELFGLQKTGNPADTVRMITMTRNGALRGIYAYRLK